MDKNTKVDKRTRTIGNNCQENESHAHLNAVMKGFAVIRRT